MCSLYCCSMKRRLQYLCVFVCVRRGGGGVTGQLTASSFPEATFWSLGVHESPRNQTHTSPPCGLCPPQPRSFSGSPLCRITTLPTTSPILVPYLQQLCQLVWDGLNIKVFYLDFSFISNWLHPQLNFLFPLFQLTTVAQSWGDRRRY